MNNIQKNIVVVDDFLIVRKGVELIVKESLPLCNLFFAKTYDEVLEVLKTIKVDLVLLDINMYGEENVLIMSQIKALQTKCKILVFTSYDEKKYGVRYVKNGADGFINKLSTDQELLSAILSVLNKGSYYSDTLKNLLVKLNDERDESDTVLLDKLSNREFEIYNLLINGYGNLEISNKLNIHMSTVSTLKNRLFKKLKVYNIVELLEFAQKQSNL
ncbi:response regulator transcription factor [Flavobacterium croceum]|uniref:response regulator transcription factor n=1 Tax=Flavobacterium croceum TaxID=370975 RepID=UPI0024A8AFC6|nr:response regulator transcription factor [Flavobacterium croceum]